MQRFFAFALMVALAACMPKPHEDAPTRAPLPEGAVKTGDGLYMIPLKQPDVDGCQGYRQYSPGNMVTMAIYYRDSEGRFTANKLQADCYAKD